MNGLRELQHQLIAALFSQINIEENSPLNSQISIEHAIHSHELSVHDRLQIHRNNIIYQLTKALRQIYPTVELLVGIDFFKVMALNYINKYPSTVKNLYHYGEQLNQFIKTYPPANSLPYLSEIAELEWAYHQAYYGEHCESLDRNKLSLIAMDQYSALRFQLHPTARLLTFEYPVLEIWNLCHNPQHSNDTFTLRPKKTRALVVRPDLDVQLTSLTESEFIFLSALQNRQSLVDACSLALNKTPAFDIQQCMQFHICSKTIVHFS